MNLLRPRHATLLTNVTRRFFAASNGPSVELTQRGADRIKALQDHFKDDALRLRLTVEGGGCSGFQYVFETTNEDLKLDDKVFNTNGCELIIDEVSLGFVDGAKVDFTEDLIRRSFEVVDNPNAETGCGCGASFALKDGAKETFGAGSSDF